MRSSSCWQLSKFLPGNLYPQFHSSKFKGASIYRPEFSFHRWVWDQIPVYAYLNSFTNSKCWAFQKYVWDGSWIRQFANPNFYLGNSFLSVVTCCPQWLVPNHCIEEEEEKQSERLSPCHIWKNAILFAGQLWFISSLLLLVWVDSKK